MKYSINALLACAFLFASCEEQKPASNIDTDITSATPVLDTTDARSGDAKNEEYDTIVATADEPLAITSLRDRFPKNGFEWKILDFLSSDQPEIVIALDKIPFEGEELSAEGESQLDNLVTIHQVFPYLLIDVQAHTTEAANGVARQTKRTASKARAVWVATKLSFKGIPSNKLSSSGMADDLLLPDYSGDDKRQKRIMAKITKPSGAQ
jgi:hypothetical protein